MSDPTFNYGPPKTTEEIIKGELESLKNIWLNHHPESHHPTDTKNFIRYALRLARLNNALDHEEMRRHGITTPRIREYQREYEFLRDVLDVIDEPGGLPELS